MCDEWRRGVDERIVDRGDATRTDSLPTESALDPRRLDSTPREALVWIRRPPWHHDARGASEDARESNQAMTRIGTRVTSFLRGREMRQNVRALLRYLLLLVAVTVIYAVLFHVIMLYVEGREYSWITGLYWTLTVMSTEGFGDITFTSDIGRLFTTVVLVTGIVLLLIVLPFLFIRYFYAPWFEEQLRQRMRAPHVVPAGTRGHVVMARYDTVAARLVERLRVGGIPYCVLEPDAATAQRLHAEGVAVVQGEIDSRATYEAVRLRDAALLLANAEDTTNTNITLTAREVTTEVPIVAIASDDDAIDILELAGSTHVLPLRRSLGEHLANRANAGPFRAHVIGRYRDLLIAEFAAQNTPLAGRTVRETNLRAATGVSIVGYWERGRMHSVGADTKITHTSVVVVIGNVSQIDALNELLAIYDVNDNPVVVIGGGKVGRSAARALREEGIAVHMVERNPALKPSLEGIPNKLVIGDASDRQVLREAGLQDAPSVILTTHDDAMNIYLAVYCRRLNPKLQIISRVTHERNIEAMHRAGADLVLSYDALGVESVLSILQRRELTVLGAGFHLFFIPVPPSLVGKTLSEGGIGARTGMTVVAIQKDGEAVTNPPPEARLEAGGELILLGSEAQRERFAEVYG